MKQREYVGFNRITIVGKLHGKINYGKTASGLEFCNLVIACRDYNKTTFTHFKVIAWGTISKAIVDSVADGALILIEGELKFKEYNDTKNIEITASRYLLLNNDDGKLDLGEQPADMYSNESSAPKKRLTTDDIDDIPF